MSKFNAINGASMVDAAVKQIPVEDRNDSRYFGFDPEEGTLLHIEESDNVSATDVFAGGFLYRVDFSEEGSFIVTLIA